MRWTLLLLFLYASTIAFAQWPLDTTQPTAVACSLRTNAAFVCAKAYLAAVLKFVYMIALFAGVAILVVSGIKYITAGGNTQTIAQASRGIIWALIGLAVALLSLTIARALETSVKNAPLLQ